MSAASCVQQCACCGGREFDEKKVLWPELIEEWKLSADETRYVDRQQGLACRRCGSSLRTTALALAICRSYGYQGTFSRFVRERKARRLRVLEINEAGQLTQFLSGLPRYTIARYPQIDMARMPYADCSFDLVVHSDTLEHVSDPVTGLRECHRILTPGGFCAFTIPVIVGRMTRSRAGLAPSYHGDPKGSRRDFPVHTEYGADAWEHLMCAGFSDCRIVTPEYPSALAFVGTRWN